VGSAFKPFVFATALSEGWSSWDWLDDSPYRLASRGGRAWEPANFDGQFLGPITVREALVMSRNVPTVRLAEAVGVDDVVRMARASGLRGDIPESPVIALGVTEASPLELTTAYAVFANGGESITPRLITRVTTRDGKVVWAPDQTRRRRVIEGEVARGITELLRDAVDYGTGRAVRSAGYRGPAAGKTGTTNDGTDAWFVGYTPRLVASVWVGFDRARPIAARVSGGTVAAEIWGRAMRRIDTRGADWPDRIEAPRFEPEPRPRQPDRWTEAPSRQRGRFEHQRADALERLAEELEDALEDVQSEREGAREVRRFLEELARELERHGDADWEDVLTEEILRALPRWLSENGREIRFESSRSR
jgi:membrane peptidoglycan carboxypeptidase